MSISLARYENLQPPPPPEKTWLWIVVYENGGTTHNDETNHHWAYVIGTKTDVLQRKGIRFNVWKCHRLELGPESKLQHQDKIFEPESALSSHGGCHTQKPFSFFQLAQNKDGNAFRRHLLTYAIPDTDGTSGWTCHDWVRTIFDNLPTDRAISLCQSTRSQGRINDFAEVEAECAVPGVHRHEDAPGNTGSWKMTEQGIQTKTSQGTTHVEVEYADREVPTSPRTQLLENLRRQISRE